MELFFLVRHKTEVTECVRLVRLKCLQHGHQMESVRCDSGSVELGKEFQEKCQSQGIEVKEAAVEHQEQNPVERHLQTAGASITAMLTGQSLLEAKWWGWAAMAYWVGHNAMSNHLCPDTSPNMVFEKKNN